MNSTVCALICMQITTFFLVCAQKGKILHMSLQPSTISTGFGQRLREERQRLGLTQTELAQIGGVKRLAQSQYERETSSPTVRYLAAIAGAGIRLNVLLYGESAPAPVLFRADQYRIERQAFDLVEAHVRHQPEEMLGAEGRFALFQVFRSQLTENALSVLSKESRINERAQKLAA